MAGKGDRRIPAQVPNKQVEDNWDKIFGKGKKVTLTVLRGNNGNLRKEYANGWKSKKNEKK